MIYFQRDIQKKLFETFKEQSGQVIVLYGPRQAGKTTLLKELLKNTEHLWLNGDDLETQDQLSKHSLIHLQNIVGLKPVLAIDEAQRIENIGLSLKLLADNMPKLKIVVSGSASFDLAKKLSEPLTGRTATFWVYPLSAAEVGSQRNWALEKDNLLQELLILGSLPKIFSFSSKEEKQSYLKEYLNSYLYRDILALGQVRSPKKVVDLLTLLALQLGNEVSTSELASALAINRKTVEHYLEILEKLFMIVNLRGFSRNLRKEISKTSKYYFFDLGLRNALIANFNNLNLRNDAGQLFENFFIMEKLKKDKSQNGFANFYFWRTYEQKEIDLIEEAGGQLTAYEAKWQDRFQKTPKEFLKTYPGSNFFAVNKDNFLEFLKK